MAEEFRLESALGERARVHRHHRLRRAGRERVERARDDLLACSVLACDEDVGVRRADVAREFEDGLHRCGGGDEERARAVAVCAQHLVLGFEPLALSERARQLDLRAEYREQARVVPGLLHEVARAALHRLDRKPDAAPRRHHDDGKRRVNLAHAREEV